MLASPPRTIPYSYKPSPYLHIDVDRYILILSSLPFLIMNRTDQEFAQRVSQIPFHGIGLSVDVYTPNVFELTDQLDRNGLVYGYLEIFKADQSALQEVRSRRPSIDLEYHADGLWVTQPDWMTTYPFEDELRTTMTHLSSLGCTWLNQECASKQIGGHSFGTYLPPLFSESSAQVTACNVKVAQGYLDDHSEGKTLRSPFFLLETPPLTYFGIGDIPYAEFFRVIANCCSCGFVLDIGHIWTVYRYSGAWEHQSVDQFLEEFLSAFPLERVVQIHIAGLDYHPIVPHRNRGNDRLPNWIDAHEARIPSVLFDMLAQVLPHPRLINLKGLAMEVDSKPIELIIEEFAGLRKRYGGWEQRQCVEMADTVAISQQPIFFSSSMRAHVPRKDEELTYRYQQLVSMVTCRMESHSIALSNKGTSDISELRDYSGSYLPYEIFKWGGDLKDMFPQTMQSLEVSGKGLSDFMAFWYSHPHSFCEPYDFFLLKVHYFVEYIRGSHASLLSLASREADDLRDGYALACQHTSTTDS